MQVSKKIYNCLLLYLSVISSVWIAESYAHGSKDHPTPTKEQLSQVEPAIPGAYEFALELSKSGSELLTNEAHNLLDEVVDCYTYSEDLRSEKGADDLESDYYRWQGDQHLLLLAKAIPSLVDINPSRGYQVTDRVIKIAGQKGYVMFKVSSFGDSVSFKTQKLSLRSERNTYVNPVNIASEGDTYVILELDEIPSEKQNVVLTFKPEGAENSTYSHVLKIERQELGQLALRVIDETGEPSPVLLRITGKSNGRMWEPPNAVDLNPIMFSVTSLSLPKPIVEEIYGPGRGFRFGIPGPFVGRYWVVPKPFDMALPEGEYSIHIWHGPEYVPVIENFTVTKGKWLRKEIKLDRWESMADRGWYSGDDHVHSRLIDSVDADKLIACARATDTNVSNILEMGDSATSWYSQRGFGKEFRVQEGNYVLVPGQEDPRSFLGHAIGMNLTSLARDLDRYLHNDWIADEIHKQGGLYGQTHVGEKACLSERDMALSIPEGKTDFNSILQFHVGTEWYYDFLNLGYRIVASAGSDTPYGGSLGGVRVYSYIGKGKPFSADAWFDAFAAGRTFVTNGPMLEFTVDGKLPGEEIVIDGKRTLKVKAKTWGLPGNTAANSLKIVVMGETVKEVAVDGWNEKSLEIAVDVDCEHGCWIAAHATGPANIGAHTTPVYVRRDGFRHWNVDKAESIIDNQLKIIDGIDDAISAAEQIKQRGELRADDFWHKRIVDQADYVRNRNNRVRGIYAELKETLKREKRVRGK